MLLLEKYGPKSLFCIKIRLLQSSKSKLSNRQLENFKIMGISNKYKDTFDSFLDS